MTRLIDADKLIIPSEEIVARMTIDNAPTVDTDLSKYSDKLWKEAYERGKNERPQGEWIGEHFVYKCSKCGHIADSVLSVTGRNIIPMLSNYCPECGADMREEA